METINTKVRKWGNSFGIVLPKSVVNKQKIKEGIQVEINIRTKDKSKVKDIFGILKGKIGDTEKLMQEVNKELWNIKK